MSILTLRASEPGAAFTRVVNVVKDLPRVASAHARFRTSPKAQVDLLLRAARNGLSVAKLAATPGGVDLGPLRSQLPDRLHTPTKRIDLAAPIALADLDRLRSRFGGITEAVAVQAGDNVTLRIQNLGSVSVRFV